MGEKSNHWRKPLSKNDKEVLKRDFDNILRISRGGLLTTKQRKRLLGSKKSTEGENEKKLWFDIRNSANTAFLDLQLICRIASENQLQDIFEPLDTKDLPKDKEGKPDPYGRYTRNHPSTFLNLLLSEKTKDSWRYRFAAELIETTVSFLRWKPEFDSQLYQRAFNDVLDISRMIKEQHYTSQ